MDGEDISHAQNLFSSFPSAQERKKFFFASGCARSTSSQWSNMTFYSQDKFGRAKLKNNFFSLLSFHRCTIGKLSSSDSYLRLVVIEGIKTTLEKIERSQWSCILYSFDFHAKDFSSCSIIRFIVTVPFMRAWEKAKLYSRNHNRSCN